MIIQKQKLDESQTLGVESSTDMTIDMTDPLILQMVLADNLYSDEIGSPIREWTSNALDATREIKSDEPVVVSLKQENYDYYFRVTDKGIGISPERAEKVLSKLLASTKRNSADQLGFFGLGLKSAFSYTDSFTIESNYEGTMYIYNYYKAEETKKLDLLLSQPTNQPNGSTFSFKLKNRYDYSNFIQKIKEQLCYFEGVYFDCEHSIDNNFKIISTDHWKYSELSQDDNMHLCLDNVYYPLDYNKLGIKQIAVPIALNFKTSEGIIPIPNRESIKYTATVKALIMDKIRLVAEDFVNRYNDSIAEVDNFFSVWEKLGDDYRTVRLENVRDIPVNAFQEYSTIKFKPLSVKGIEKLDLLNVKNNCGVDLQGWFYPKGCVYNNRFTGKDDGNLIALFRSGYNQMQDIKENYVLCQESPTKLMLDYIKFKAGYSRTFLYGNSSKKRDLKNYIRLLRLKTYKKTEWRQLIKEYQVIEDGLATRFTKLEDIIPTEEWLAERKLNRAKGNRTNVTKEDINPRRLVRAGANCRWNTTASKGELIDVSQLHKDGKINLYFPASIDDVNRSKIDKLYNIFSQGNMKRDVWELSDRDYKKLEDKNITNWKKALDFMEGIVQEKAFGNYCTKYVVSKMLQKYTKEFGFKDTIQLLSKDFYAKMDELSKFAGDRYYVSNASGDVMDYMLKICEEKKLWNLNIIALSKEVEAKIKIFDFLNHLKGLGTYEKMTPELMKICVEILKSRRFKLNIELYELPLNDEVTIVENVPEVVEEDVEEEVA